MPSGKTHDVITLICAAPVCAGAFAYAGLTTAIVITGGFLLGGLLFGPDLDTISRQNSRWGFLKPFWLPYRMFFKHRSRWSHGLIFGTLFRVIYFAGVVTIAGILGVTAAAAAVNVSFPDSGTFIEAWRMLGDSARERVGIENVAAALLGTWLGSASHTLTDITVTFVRTGRRGGIL